MSERAARSVPTARSVPGGVPCPAALGWGSAEQAEAEVLVAAAFREDMPDGDQTTAPLFPREETTFSDGSKRGGLSVRARGVAREVGIVSGLPVVDLVFRTFDSELEVVFNKREGDSVGTGDVLFEVSGAAAPILSAERTALNFLGRLSGISSRAAVWVARVREISDSCALLDTPKTTPSWRRLEKYAVRAGGATNHRGDLSSGVMIKDNHADLLRRSGAGSVAAWVETIRRESRDAFLQVEVDDREEFLAARACPIDSILLDNFSIEDLEWAVSKNEEDVEGWPEKVPTLEASGGIRLENVGEVAATGVDRISVGALTHSARWLDVSLETSAVE